MTILTSSQPGKPEEKVDPSTGVIFEGKIPLPDSDIPPPAYIEVPLSSARGDPRVDELRFYLAARRRRFLTTFCAALLVLWLLLAAIIGGLLLYRYFNRRPFYGFCGADVSFNGDDGSIAKRERLQQKVEIDSHNDYEKIEVPKFGFARPAIFVHDFKQNLTAIADLKGQRCFIKPLDRDRISPPQSFIDLIRKMEEGYYEQSADVIRLHYVARMPPLSSQALAALNSWMIQSQCQYMTTYMLERVDAPPAGSEESHESNDQRRKRSLSADGDGFVQFIPARGVYHYDIHFKE